MGKHRMLILEIVLLSVNLYFKLDSSSDPQINLDEIVDCPTDLLIQQHSFVVSAICQTLN